MIAADSTPGPRLLSVATVALRLGGLGKDRRQFVRAIHLRVGGVASHWFDPIAQGWRMMDEAETTGTLSELARAARYREGLLLVFLALA